MYTIFASFLPLLPLTPHPKKHCFSALLCLSLKRIETLKCVHAMFRGCFSVWRKQVCWDSCLLVAGKWTCPVHATV